MKHCIIVKFRAGHTDWPSWLPDIQALFDRTLLIPGISAVRLITGITERPNRYHLMIEMDMTPQALPVYDASEPHAEWKRRYGERIEQKAIFDHEG